MTEDNIRIAIVINVAEEHPAHDVVRLIQSCSCGNLGEGAALIAEQLHGLRVTHFRVNLLDVVPDMPVADE